MFLKALALYSARPREGAIKPSSNRIARLSACLIALALALFLLGFPLHPINGLLVDSYFRSQGLRQPSSRIVLIAFDASSTQGGESSVSAEQVAKLLMKLNVHKPKAIGFLADLDELHYSKEELDQIVSAIDGSVPVFVGFTGEASLGRPVPEIFGDRLIYSPGLVSRDSFHFGADSVSRRVMVEIDRVPTFFARLATFIRGSTPDRVEVLGTSRHAYIDWQGPTGTYPLISAWRFLSHAEPPVDVKDQIVLVGHARRGRPSQDFILTPYSRQLGDTPQLEGAAHSLVTLMEDRGLRRLPAWAIVVLTVLVGLLTAYLVSLLSPVRGILFMFGLLMVLWGIGWLGLRNGWWLDLAHSGIMAIAAYYLVVPFRLGQEYRKRWHYQQKTEMMAELETLKSNFLSLISHDLKTPIARIQGNAELLLREGGGGSEKQRKGLSTIIATTEEMSDYVQTVLDLTRIESSRFSLHKESRDINATVMEVIEEKRFLAQDKGIHVNTNLEPLFSLKYDVKLMRRVIANLLENAIKYSPESSTITVASKEEQGRVTVSISDQGYGVPVEEQEKIFTKFYRGTGPEISGTKGTGLGLYLVKYFVELHKGLVVLDSAPGKGSTFSVSLPV